MTTITLTRPTSRPPLTRPERAALAGVAVALGGFGLHGLTGGVPGTVEYLVTVSVLAAGVGVLRRRPLPASLALGLAALVVVHLAGGLVRVGDGVLYNATPGPELLRYDHFGHFLGIFLGTQLLWELLVRPAGPPSRRDGLVVLALLGGLGLGAVNETVEFLATQAHGGGHVGGYTNTGWDLVVNTCAGLAAGTALRLRHRRRPVPA